jgi:hypothetical protein
MADPAGGAAAAAIAAAADDPEEEAVEEEEEEPDTVEDEEESDNEDAVDLAGLQHLLAAFRASLVNIFGYSVVAAQAIQEHLSLTEPVDLVTNWLDDEDLRTACMTLMRNAKDFKVGNVKPVFKPLGEPSVGSGTQGGGDRLQEVSATVHVGLASQGEGY